MPTHMIVMHKKSRYTCHICGVSTQSISSLAKHYMRQHDEHKGTFPYICPQCGKTYQKLNQYKLHMHRCNNSNDKVYKCNSCVRIFSTMAEKQQHYYEEHQKRLKLCKICGRTFINMAKHIRTHHNTRLSTDISENLLVDLTYKHPKGYTPKRNRPKSPPHKIKAYKPILPKFSSAINHSIVTLNMQPKVMLKQLKLQGFYPTPDNKAISITDSHLFLPSKTEPITIRLTPIPHIVSSLSQTMSILPNTWNHKTTVQTEDEQKDIRTHDTNTQPTPQFNSYMFTVQESQEVPDHIDYEALPLHVKFFGYLPTLHPCAKTPSTTTINEKLFTTVQDQHSHTRYKDHDKHDQLVWDDRLEYIEDDVCITTQTDGTGNITHHSHPELFDKLYNHSIKLHHISKLERFISIPMINLCT